MKTKQRIYDGSIITVEGIDFKVSLTPDEDTDAPWDVSDHHGPIIFRKSKTKMPYEVLLGQYRGRNAFYDMQEAVLIARRDGWNCAPWVWRTKGEQAHNAALADMRYLRDWLAGEWEYVVLTVTALDEDGDILDFVSVSLGGVEYDPRDTGYVADEAEMLAHQIISEHSGMFAKPLTAIIEPDDELPDFDFDAARLAA